MDQCKFIGTEITFDELTEWILTLKGHERITEIRYYGSRVFGNPRSDSDIDVYLALKELEDDDIENGDEFERGPLFSKIFKKQVIEFHAFVDFGDGYIPSQLRDSKNELDGK